MSRPTPADALLHTARHAFPPGTRHVAVAVSGGGDSMALLHLLARVAPESGLVLRAVTVDHRLRPDSAAEAASVAGVCARLGVPHAVLGWDHGTLTGNLMEQARNARYGLMAHWVQTQGVEAVALGHTADDQAEGFLMALTREAGLDGLSGMQPLRRADGVLWARPLLSHTRAELRDWLARQGEPWIDDPTNINPRFLRTRARSAVQALAGLGMTSVGIARSVAMLSLSRGALESAAADFADRNVVEHAGALCVPCDAFSRLHVELQRRLLVAAVRWAGGAGHPPRRSGQMQALSAVAAGRSTTLGGVRFRVGPQAVRIVREPRAVGNSVPVGEIWDGRWRVEGPVGPQVAAVGAAGLAQIPRWRDCHVARDTLVVSPGVWEGERLIAAPAAGFGSGYSATIGRSFASFLLSH